MSYKEYLIGAAILTGILLLFGLTIIFSSQISDYSGIATFYSLLIVIFLFILKELIEKRRKNLNDFNLLRTLLLKVNLIFKNIEEYEKIFLYENWMPAYSLDYLDIEGIPIEVSGKSTIKVNELVFKANNEIDALVEKRNELCTIFVNPQISEKKREQCMGDYLKYSEEMIKTSIGNLKNYLDEIKKELRRWGIY